ncbi:stonustoxin subunit alpha-like [Sardina pilchardus]|uniref:stonustoxin subunit alpha-like n=1 Tax=Sardina pilchardus TaxID=27697 RepID=UPI002E11F7E9
MEQEEQETVNRHVGWNSVDSISNRHELQRPRDSTCDGVLVFITMGLFLTLIYMFGGPAISYLSGDIIYYLFPPALALECSLDMHTVNPLMKVTSDHTFAVRVSSDQHYPSHPSRFDDIPQALTTECVSTGKHSWLVEVQGHWDIGMAYKNISRKGTYGVRLGTNKESWSIRHNKMGHVLALHNNERRKIETSLDISMIQKIAVTVDFERGTISFARKGIRLESLYGFKASFDQPVCLGFGLYSLTPQSTASIVKTYEK